MLVFEKYLQLKEKSAAEDAIDNDELAEKYMDEAIELRNNYFTKSDWEELIAQSYGRAKYEYTRLMKQRFPED